MKLKGCLIIGGLFLTALVIFAGLFTRVNNIKSYKFSLTRDELEERLVKLVNSNPKLTFKAIGTTGTEPNNLNYYADIGVTTKRRSYKFSIKYFTNSNIFDRGIHSEISLNDALVLRSNIRGDSIVYLDTIISIFEKYIINELDKNTSR